jgi:hypothetical protein
MIINGQFLQWIVNNLRWMSLLLFTHKTARKNGQPVSVIDAMTPDGRTFRFDSSSNNLSGFREPRNDK